MSQSLPARGPAACSCTSCSVVRAQAKSRAEEELARIMKARADERQRIVSMLLRFAAIDEDGGELVEAEVQRSLVRCIEELEHLGPSGEPFVSLEAES